MITTRERERERERELARYHLDNTYDWSRDNQASLQDRLSNLRQDTSRSVPNLNDPWDVDNNASSSTSNITQTSTPPRTSSPIGSDGSGDTIKPTDTPQDMAYKIYKGTRN